MEHRRCDGSLYTQSQLEAPHNSRPAPYSSINAERSFLRITGATLAHETLGPAAPAIAASACLKTESHRR